ncbi:DarT ssDNA thymidine ADP-ribosyltransferase family protein [Psychrobacillus sp. L4]|uniref:DarT ssDNA thymidine ADP-ribosyltransferase family protein n=1 Tax=Psychrobacillus sp. L4 TaxID=3236892 RepID=UPI0036F3E805
MAIGNIKEGRLLYHLTRLSNLDSILEHGLVSRKLVKDNDVKFFDIADQEIISKRTELGLDEYTPFHFHPYSSFDVAVKNTYVDEEFIYICIRRELAKDNNFKVLPRHPLTNEEFRLYDYEEGLNAIDWVTMHTLGTEDRYTKNVKMAECLTPLIVPAKLFHCIYVKNEETRADVKERLQSSGISKTPPFVDIGRWL